MKGRYLAEHHRNTEHTGLRRLLSVILCLCLLTSVLQIQMITAFAATKIDSVTVTHEGRKTEKLILPQNERATLQSRVLSEYAECCLSMADTCGNQIRVLGEYLRRDKSVNVAVLCYVRLAFG